MSAADDLLFSPIHPAPPAGQDFLVRKNAAYPHGYDWKPMTDRAHLWLKAYLNYSYLQAQQHNDGWVEQVSTEPNAPVDNPAPWVQKLIEENYIFEVET